MKNNSLDKIKSKAKKLGETDRQAEIRRLRTSLAKLQAEEDEFIKSILIDIMDWEGCSSSLEAALEELLLQEFGYYGPEDEVDYWGQK